MKINVAPLQNLIEESHLDKDNTHTKIWCSDNIDYRIEHVIYKCFDLYPQLLHGQEIRGLSIYSFQILINMKN